MDFEISKEALLLLAGLYRLYLSRRESGIPRSSARHFLYFQNKLPSDLSMEMVETNCSELVKAGLVYAGYDSGILLCASLEASAISYMEKLAGRRVSQVTLFITSLI